MVPASRRLASSAILSDFWCDPLLQEIDKSRQQLAGLYYVGPLGKPTFNGVKRWRTVFQLLIPGERLTVTIRGRRLLWGLMFG